MNISGTSQKALHVHLTADDALIGYPQRWRLRLPRSDRIRDEAGHTIQSVPRESRGEIVTKSRGPQLA